MPCWLWDTALTLALDWTIGFSKIGQHPTVMMLQFLMCISVLPTAGEATGEIVVT